MTHTRRSILAVATMALMFIGNAQAQSFNADEIKSLQNSVKTPIKQRAYKQLIRNTFSWSRRITNADREFYNFPAGVNELLTLRTIFTGGTSTGPSVREDGYPCGRCHGVTATSWGIDYKKDSTTNSDFTDRDLKQYACETMRSGEHANTRDARGFINQRRKPAYLKNLFRNWVNRGCP